MLVRIVWTKRSSSLNLLSVQVSPLLFLCIASMRMWLSMRNNNDSQCYFRSIAVLKYPPLTFGSFHSYIQRFYPAMDVLLNMKPMFVDSRRSNFDPPLRILGSCWCANRTVSMFNQIIDFEAAVVATRCRKIAMCDQGDGTFTDGGFIRGLLDVAESFKFRRNRFMGIQQDYRAGDTTGLLCFDMTRNVH